MASKKHYIAIAKAFANEMDKSTATDRSVEWARVTLLQELAKQIADVLAQDNAAFRRQQFLEACGVL